MEKLSNYQPFSQLRDEKPYTFDRFVRLLLSIAVLIGIIWVVRSLSGVLIPFFLALLLAYLSEPLVVFVQTKMRVRHRGISVLITMMFFLSMFAILLWWFIPQFISEFTRLIELLKTFLQTRNYQDFIPEKVSLWLKEFFVKERVNELLNADNINQAASIIFNSAKSVLSGSISIITAVIGALIVLLYLFFILLDYKKIESEWASLITKKHRPLVTAIADDLKKSMKVYFRAQFTIAMIVGILMSIGFSIIKLPIAVTFGLFIGLLNIVPYLQIVGFIPALFLAMLKSMETQQSFVEVALLILLVMAIVQVIQETILIPRIMGKAYNMNPALILLSLSIWGSLMGVIGMLLALPLTTVMLSYYKQLIVNKGVSENDNPEPQVEDVILPETEPE